MIFHLLCRKMKGKLLLILFKLKTSLPHARVIIQLRTLKIVMPFLFIEALTTVKTTPSL